MKTTFETWFQELCSNHVWAEPAQLQHRPETFKKICEKVHMDYLAGNGVKSIEECRRHVYNIVVKTPPDNKKVDWVKMALDKTKDKKEEEWKPVSEEEREEWLKKWKQEVEGMQMISAVPKLTVKQVIDEGGWRATPVENPRSEIERLIVIEEHKEKVNAARRKVFTSAYPDASEEEIKAYLNKFDIL